MRLYNFTELVFKYFQVLVRYAALDTFRVKFQRIVAGFVEEILARQFLFDNLKSQLTIRVSIQYYLLFSFSSLATTFVSPAARHFSAPVS